MARGVTVAVVVVVALVVMVCLFSGAEGQAKKMAKAKKMGKPPKKRVAAVVKGLQKNVTALWGKVEMLSQPVHVHIHGDSHLMDHHDHHGHHDENDDHQDHHDRHGDHDYDVHHHDHHHHHHHDHPCDPDHDSSSSEEEEDDEKDKMKDDDRPMMMMMGKKMMMKRMHGDQPMSDRHKKARDHKRHGKHGHDDDDDEEEYDEHDHKHHDKHERKHKKHHDDHDHDHDHDHEKDHAHHHHHHDKHDHKDHKHDGDHKHEDHDHDHDHHFHHDHDEHHDHEDHHEGHGTHVHIHLHTGDMEKRKHRHHDLPPDPPKEYRYARCDVVANRNQPNTQYIQGFVMFRQMPESPLEMKVDIRGFPIDQRLDEKVRYLRAIHGHVFGDVSQGCARQGGHYNPHGIDHGGPAAKTRHPGDFGNMMLERDGSVKLSFNDTHGSLFGHYSLLGRGIVIHAGADDYGLEDHPASKKSGNAGPRVACCAVIACPEPPGIWS